MARGGLGLITINLLHGQASEVRKSPKFWFFIQKQNRAEKIECKEKTARLDDTTLSRNGSAGDLTRRRIWKSKNFKDIFFYVKSQSLKKISSTMKTMSMSLSIGQRVSILTSINLIGHKWSLYLHEIRNNSIFGRKLY